MRPQDRWNAKAGYISKSYKLKRELVEEFSWACERDGVSQAQKLSELMKAFINQIGRRNMENLNKIIEMIRENFREHIFIKDDVYYLLEPVKYVYAYNDPDDPESGWGEEEDCPYFEIVAYKPGELFKDMDFDEREYGLYMRRYIIHIAAETEKFEYRIDGNYKILSIRESLRTPEKFYEKYLEGK